MQGGKATHDQSDAPNMAVLLRGGRLPQADVDPAAMRATRDRLRRRFHLPRQRAERLAHGQKTTSQDNLPERRQPLASKANREGVAARFPAPAGQQSVEVDLALLDADDRGLSAVEWTIVQTAKQHHAPTRYRLPSVPGIGTILRLVRRYESHALARFPRVQAFVSSGRRIKGAKASAGTRSGTAGAKSGTADLTWACSDAAVLLLRHNPAGQN